MQKIGIISDTHLQTSTADLELTAARYFSDVDLIIHAGDIVSPAVLDAFFALGKKVEAVCGNMDPPEIGRMFPFRRILTVENARIGIIHGWGSPQGIRDRIRSQFHQEKVDAIVYGHSHAAYAATENAIYFFNPGSFSRPRFTSDRTIGIMEVNRKTVTGKIITL